MDNNVEKNEYPGMDTTYEWGRIAPEQLSKEADSLDTKIIGLFAAASIIISVVATLAKEISVDWRLIPFVVAGLSFLVLFSRSIQVLRGYKFFVTDDPKILREDWWILDPNEVKIKYWASIERAFENNYKAVDAKERAVQIIVPLLAVEVLSLIVWLFLL